MSDSVVNAPLSPARKALLDLVQRIYFGRIEGLQVRGGEPVLDPRPRSVREIKFGGRNEPSRLIPAGALVLKPQVAEFLRCLDDVKDGTVDRIEVQHGLPFRMIVEDKERA
jgi:hypothetical protein